MYKHVNAIVERKYYYDDSSVRYNMKRNYYKYDISALFLQNGHNCQPQSGETVYQKKQKVWHYICNVEVDNAKKNIFYLYYYEHKKQEEIAYLLEVSQPYIVKVLKQIKLKIKRYLYELQGCQPDGQLLLRFDEI